MKQYRSFEEFWPDYMHAHDDPRTQAAHVAGTLAGLACAAKFVSTKKPSWALAGLAAAYGSAWASHALIERNRPATFAHPLWSLRGYFRMMREFLTREKSGPDADGLNETRVSRT